MYESILVIRSQMNILDIPSPFALLMVSVVTWRHPHAKNYPNPKQKDGHCTIRVTFQDTASLYFKDSSV